MALQLFKEPLVGFFLAGMAIFAISGLLDRDGESRTIIITSDQIDRISEQWQMQMGRPPAPSQLNGLLDDWIREEIYYREARLRGLQHNDAIIRRRLVQKLTFLTEDLAVAESPDDDALQAFYQSHLGKYVQAPALTFEHRFYSNDRRSDAEADALAALTESDPKGDPFILQRSYANRTLQEIGDLFGTRFAEQLAGYEESSGWQGPVSSAYGWHLVRITDKQAARQRSFDEVRSEVQSDLQRHQREAANEALFDQLRAGYRVEYPEAKP